MGERRDGQREEKGKGELSPCSPPVTLTVNPTSILVSFYYPLLTTGCAGVSCCISESIRHLIDRFPAEYPVILDDARGRL